MEKTVGIGLGFGVCSTPEGQLWMNDGNAILSNIEGLIIFVTEWRRR
jgi:hypothetical protein